ncbi:MAG: LamB/YcsF family protein [Thermaerobacter sp.]|nr:LamB/YcsF family protein [Thermaerobacter sp.]
MKERVVDINSDMGESFGVFRIGEDAELMRSVSSANVACGFHAGDPSVMLRTVGLAQEAGVGVGAHPGFPDRVGFGRRNLALSPDEAYSDTLYQIGALAAFCRAAGVDLQHVKPHGQLNNMAVRDAELARAIAQAVRDFREDLILISYGGELTLAAERLGVRVAHEVYADRAYNADRTLLSRSIPGSVLHDPELVVERAVRMVLDGGVHALSGEWIELQADTICVHSDTPGAASLASRLRARLAKAQIEVRPLAQFLA